MCVNNLSKVALASAAAGIEPATSSRKSNALTTEPPSRSIYIPTALQRHNMIILSQHLVPSNSESPAVPPKFRIFWGSKKIFGANAPTPFPKKLAPSFRQWSVGLLNEG